MVDAANAALERPGISTGVDVEALDLLLEHHVRETFMKAEISATCDALYEKVLQRQVANLGAGNPVVAAPTAATAGRMSASSVGSVAAAVATALAAQVVLTL